MIRDSDDTDHLRTLNRFLDSIIENIPNMIFIKDAEELRFVRFNRAGEELLGVPRTALLGKSDHDLFPAEQAAFFQAKDRETLRNGVVVDIAEEPIQTAAGERWLHTKKIPILDDGGAPAFLLGISEDITERRANLEGLRTAKEATERANGELEAFCYSVAHDLRAPLRSIDGFANAILDDAGPALGASGRAYLGRVVGAAHRMSSIIDGLLTLSRVTRGELRREAVDMSALAETALSQLRAEHPERRVHAEVQPALRDDADPRLARLLLENLIGNAWKFTAGKPEAHITFAALAGEGPPTYVVRDDGVGFDMAHTRKLFAPFERLHPERDFPGTGVGLATAFRIVQRHGGRIWAESATDRGASFYFTLG
jgi:PAS domain S-box-containing protein